MSLDGVSPGSLVGSISGLIRFAQLEGPSLKGLHHIIDVGVNCIFGFTNVSFLHVLRWCRGLLARDYRKVHHISKMYFSLWTPPGVSERMWSVSFEVSISGEYQTLGGHSGRLSEQLGSLMTGTEVTGISDDWYRTTMGVIVISLRACRSARGNFCCTGECRQTNAGITNKV